jgi:hypothetical protein
MIKTIVIQSIEKDRIAVNKNKYHFVIDTDGMEYSLFMDTPEKQSVAGAFLTGEGTKLKIEYTMNGKYPEVTKAEVLQYMPPRPGYSAEEKKLRLACLQCAVTLTCARDTATARDTTIYAEVFYKYIQGDVKVDGTDIKAVIAE